MKRSLAAFAFASIFAASVARADDDSLQRATAAYSEGMDRRAAGKIQASLEKLQQAHSLYPTAITGLELGRTLMLLGRLVEAREAMLSVARLGPRANESARANNARAEAASLAVAIGERLPRLVFKHEGAAPAVTVDGASVIAIDAPHAVDPGPHRVQWDHETRDVTLAEGQTEVIALSTTGPVPAPTTQPASPSVESPGSPSRVPVWIGVALTGAASAAGSVSGVLALTNADTARPSCTDNRCLPAVHDAADAAKSWSSVSTISFVAAGALAAATLVVYLATRGGAKQPPRIGSLSVSF